MSNESYAQARFERMAEHLKGVVLRMDAESGDIERWSDESFFLHCFRNCFESRDIAEKLKQIRTTVFMLDDMIAGMDDHITQEDRSRYEYADLTRRLLAEMGGFRGESQ